MASKKQTEHMVQNIVHKVNNKIKEMERNENCPKEHLESALWNHYYDEKWKEQK